MEESMNYKSLPNTDSIEQLAQFWDAHDLTDFEDQLEEVLEPVFEAGTITVHLEPDQVEAVKQIAKSHGTLPAKLIEMWVDEKIDSTRLGPSV